MAGVTGTLSVTGITLLRSRVGIDDSLGLTGDVGGDSLSGMGVGYLGEGMI